MKIPEDEEQRNIIDKLANFVARNGPKFEELTKSKQKDNTKFAFLFGGDYHDYYKWKVGLEATQSEAQKLLQSDGPVARTQVPEAPRKTDLFDVTEFRELVQKLILACTKDNIQNGKNWIVSKAKTDNEIKLTARSLLHRLLEEVLPFQQKLHIIYLANDVLHHSRKKELPQLMENLQEFILPIVAVTYNGESTENQVKLTKVLKIWENQKFFTDEIREKIKNINQLYDSQLDVIEQQQAELKEEKEKKKKEEEEEEEEQRKKNEELKKSKEHYPYGICHEQPPQQNFQTAPQDQLQQYQQYDNQWHPRPPAADPYHFYGQQYTPQPRPPFEPQPDFPPFQQGFPPSHGPEARFDAPPAQPPYQQFGGGFQGNQQVQTFDYSHQRLPAMGAGSEPVTFDYEHGHAPLPDGAPPMHEGMRDPTIPMAPYHDLPAGLMVPLVKLWDCEYKSLDSKDLRLPIPQPPSERLLAAVEAFYSPPSHDRPRDNQGWEKNGLFEFYKAKLKYIKDKERKVEIIERSPSPPSSRSPSPESETDQLVKDRKPHSRSVSPKNEASLRKRSRSPSPDSHYRKCSKSPSPKRRRSMSRSRSRSYSRSPRKKSRSRSNSCSRSRSRSPVRRSPVRRSPTPPTGFVGFETKSMDSRIEETNVGHQLLKKMGWGGQGLGKKESGILDPIKGGEVRDRQDQFKGIGVEMNDPFESYRKNKSYTYFRPRERDRKK